MSDLTAEHLDALERALVAIENDYTPTCKTVSYGNGCPGATDDSIEFWRRAADCTGSMITELRRRRAADLTEAELTTLKAWRSGLIYEHGRLAVEPLIAIFDRLLAQGVTK